MPALPHAHAPLMQRSVRCVTHVVHTAPATPHEVDDCAWHTPLKQQPSGHDVASQPVQVPP